MQVLNDLLTNPAANALPVIDPEVNQSTLMQINKRLQPRRNKQEDSSQRGSGLQLRPAANEMKRTKVRLSQRKQNAMKDIEEMGRLMSRRREMEKERWRLTQMLAEQGRGEEEGSLARLTAADRQEDRPRSGKELETAVSAPEKKPPRKEPEDDDTGRTMRELLMTVERLGADESLDLSLAPSQKSIAWWQQLTQQYSDNREAFRQ